MRLIFVRHAEPDYKNDSLTEKGFREAGLLAKRAAAWPVDAIYISPLGRAQATAAPTLEALGMKGETCPWMQEYSALPVDENGLPGRAWDLPAPQWTADCRMLDAQHWPESQIFARSITFEGQPPFMFYETPSPVECTGNACLGQSRRVWDGIDGILAKNGYRRSGLYYKVEASNEKTLVFFAHLGVIDVMLGHVLNIAAPILWHGFFLPPSSITVLSSEEREGTAFFRAQTYGDTAHLYAAGEPVSHMGCYSTDVFTL